jgi:hypothetical protein
MQYASCKEDGKVWEASSFSQLPPAELEAKRRSLECVECKQFAWFRKESTHGHPAHFCAHHAENCNLRVEYIVVDNERGDATQDESQVDAGDAIIVRLDQEQGQEVDVKEVQPAGDLGQAAGGKRFIAGPASRESSQHFTLRRILYRLVQSPNFRESQTPIALYRSENEVLIAGPVADVVFNFVDISRERHHEKLMLYWGPIASAGRTKDGKIWLNSSSENKSASIAIFEDVAPEFQATFKIEDLEDLAGAHVLVAARCVVAESGKPVIWCGSAKTIVIRRYREQSEKVSG